MSMSDINIENAIQFLAVVSPAVLLISLLILIYMVRLAQRVLYLETRERQLYDTLCEVESNANGARVKVNQLRSEMLELDSRNIRRQTNLLETLETNISKRIKTK